MNLQSILDTTAERFDDKWYKMFSNVPGGLNLEQLHKTKSFIRASQLSLLQAVKDSAEEMKDDATPLGPHASKRNDILSELIANLDIKS